MHIQRYETPAALDNYSHDFARLCNLHKMECQRQTWQHILSTAVLEVEANGLPMFQWLLLGPYSGIRDIFLTFHRSNALTIHYTSNDQMIPEGSLILMDAGGEYK